MDTPRILVLTDASVLADDLAAGLDGLSVSYWKPGLEPAVGTLLLADLSRVDADWVQAQVALLRRHIQALPLLLVLPSGQPEIPPEGLQPLDLIWRPLNVDELHARIRLLAERAHGYRAEAERLNVEAGFRQIFEAHHAMMLLLNPATGRIVDANPAASRYYGYDRDLLKSMQIQQINLLSEQEISREMERARQEVYNYFTFLHRLASGEVRTVEVHSTPVEIDGEQLLFSIIHDITHRRKAEEALQQSEAQYRQLFQLVPVGIGVADFNGRLLAFNDAMLEPGGYTRADVEILGNVKALYYQPEERHEILWDFQKTGFVNRREVRFKRKDGSPYEALLTLAPIRFGGQPCVLALVEDITERKQAERALQKSETLYRQIVETAEEGFWIIDANSRTTFANQKMADMLGCNGVEDVLGTSLFSYMDEEGLQISLRNLDRRREGISEIHDFKLLTRQGKALWTSMSTSPLTDEQGAYVGSMALVTDITARKLSEAKIQNALQEREILLREIHHRVKNNFQVIISLLNMQCRKLGAEPAANTLTEMRNRIRSMALIHEGIYQSESLADVNFADYVQYLTRELHTPGSAEHEQIKLVFALERVLLDIDQAIPCGLLVNELLTNAFKYAFGPDWQGTREVQVRLEESEGEIHLRVCDSGRGMSEDINPEAPQTLGLQLTIQLIRQLDGSWELSRSPGTCWTIRFPVHRRRREG